MYYLNPCLPPKIRIWKSSRNARGSTVYNKLELHINYNPEYTLSGTPFYINERNSTFNKYVLANMITEIYDYLNFDPTINYTTNFGTLSFTRTSTAKNPVTNVGNYTITLRSAKNFSTTLTKNFKGFKMTYTHSYYSIATYQYNNSNDHIQFFIFENGSALYTDTDNPLYNDYGETITSSFSLYSQYNERFIYFYNIDLSSLYPDMVSYLNQTLSTFNKCFSISKTIPSYINQYQIPPGVDILALISSKFSYRINQNYSSGYKNGDATTYTVNFYHSTIY